ncbi:MAG: response regulator [Bacteroidales bacterium]|nr:response regulator [Bacteroidales bacterium]
MILRRHISAVLLVSLVSVFSNVKAEPLEFIFEHYSSDDGLPYNSICDIHQDSRGYMWLCTWFGLSRYDGVNFVNYTMSPGDYSNLSHNRITLMEEDASGYLWVMTYDRHLYRFDVRQEVFVSISDILQDIHFTNPKVTEFFCDSSGDVWVSLSGAGVVRIHEDLTFETYLNNSAGSVGKYVTGIYEDSKSDIYIASEVGLAMISGGQHSLLARNVDVVSFAEKDGRLFFACRDHLLSVDMDTREQHISDFSGLGVGEVTSMTLTGRDDDIFLGFRKDAVASIDAQTLEPDVFRTDMGRVRYLYPDPEGLLWIATERTGIWSYDRKRDRFRHYEHSSNVMSYYVDTLARVVNHDGRLWIKMNNYGFGYYDRSADEIVPLHNVKEHPDCRFMNGVACYEVDDSGVLWMSTVGRGLERVTVIDPKVEVVVPPSRSDDTKSSSEVRAMLRDSKGNLWVATKSRELFMYEPDLSSCVRYPQGKGQDVGVIYSIFEDSAGNIWLGTKGDGLIRMTPKGNGWERKHFRHVAGVRNSLSSNNVYSVSQDNDGRIWVGTFGGALSMLPNPDSDAFITVDNSFPDYPQELCDRVRYLHCLPDGRMLVATVGGLILFEPSDNPELTIFNLIQKVPGDMDSLGNNDVFHIFTDSSGSTWLSTFGGGLERLYFEGGQPRFEVVGTDRGLSSNIVYSAVEADDGKIWMSTEVGLSVYDPKTSAVLNVTRYDGLPSTSYSEATCAKAEDGSLLFGTYDNIYRIIPERFTERRSDSRIVFSGLYVDGKRVPFEDRVVIPHDYSFFRIDFSSLNFGSRGEQTFSYKLEGSDKKWISGSGNRATYSHISPGQYVFKVTDSLSPDSAEGNIASIEVKVCSSIWASLPARLIYVFLGVAALFIVARILMTSWRLRANIRMEQDLNAIKARFFTNVSHELRTPLTLIVGGIDEIRRKTPEGGENEYSIDIVRKNAKRMMTLVNQLLDTRSIADGKMRLNVSRFDVVRLVQNVYDDFRDISSERQMEMRIIRSVDSLMVWGDAMRLEALVYNLLSNAFKYTSDGGKIEVGVLYRDGDSEYRIMVKDNGVGVAKDHQRAIFEPFTKGTTSAFKGMASSGIGLAFCKDITDIHGGDIWVDSDGSSGSKFFVRLPVGKDGFTEENARFISMDETQPQVTDYGLSKYKEEAVHPADALKVLLVEDNAELRIYMYNNLISRYDVRDASNGREALQVISEGWLPDMVVTDLMMPQMDGMELVNHLRNDFSTSHIPILMITAKHEDDTQVKAMKYGADGYVTKPFTMELLNARIDNMLERRRMLISRLSDISLSGSQESRGTKVSLTPEEIVITDKDELLMQKVMTWLEENIANADVTVEQLAVHVGMGRTSMYNKIKGLTGKSPVEMIQEYRMEKATYYLKSGQFSVSETSYKVGFSDPGYFSRSFKKHYGVSPADYIKKFKS